NPRVRPGRRPVASEGCRLHGWASFFMPAGRAGSGFRGYPPPAPVHIFARAFGMPGSGLCGALQGRALAHSLEKSLGPFRLDGRPDGPEGAPTGASGVAKAAGPGRPGRPAPNRPAQPPSPPHPLPAEEGVETMLAGLAAWMEPRHTLLLRTLLDRTDAVNAPSAPAV